MTSNGVRAIPTLMFFRGGQLVDKLIGMVPRSIIENTMRKCLSGSEFVELLMAQENQLERLKSLLLEAANQWSRYRDK